MGKLNLSYQWQFKGTDIVGETGELLRIQAASLLQAGPYRVIVSNSYGSVTSAPTAFLKVVEKPKIIENPADASKEDGDDVSFGVKALGEAPLSYQWRSKPTADAPYVSIAGANAPLLSLTNLSGDENGNFYSVRVFNPFGEAFSLDAKLTVLASRPRITEALTNQTVVEGTDVSFLAKVKGYRPLQYQWYRDENGLPNQTRPDFQILSTKTNDSGLYSFSVSNRNGFTQSQKALLTVEPRPPNDNFARRIDISVSTNIVRGFNKHGTAEPGELARVGIVPNHSVWWTYFATNRGVVTVDLAGSTIDTVVGIYLGTNVSTLKEVVSNDNYEDPFTGAARSTSKVQFVVDPGKEYSIAVDGKGGQVTDNRELGISLKIDFDSVFGAPIFPGALSDLFLLGGFAGDGGGCGSTSLSLPAISLVPFAYQWQYNLRCVGKSGVTSWMGLPCTPDIQWVNIPNATNQTLVLTNLTVEHSGQIRLIAANIGVSGSATSAPSTIVVSPLPAILTNSIGFTNRECTVGRLTFAVDGGCYSFNYEWYFNDRLLVSETNSVLIFTNGLAIQSGKYYGLAKNKYGATKGREVDVKFDATPIIKTQPRGLDSPANDCDALSLSIDVEPSCRPSQFQWFRNGVSIPNATNSVQAFSATLATAGDYFVRVFNEYATNDSKIAKIPVSAEPFIVQHPDTAKPRRIAAGNAFTNTVVVQSCSGLTFRWRHDNVLVILDARHQVLVENDPKTSLWKSSLVVNGATSADAGRYDVVVDNGNSTATSRVANIEVWTRPVNDDFERRISLVATNIAINKTNFYVTETIGTNILATAQVGEPQHARQNPHSSIWWTWTSPVPSLATIDLDGSDFDTLLGIYSGTNVAQLKTIDFSDDQSNTKVSSRVSFLAAKGKTFHFAVDGKNLADGGVRLSLNAQEIISPPIILIQPRSVAATNGDAVEFTVEAYGSPDIQYQWFFFNAPIPGATSPLYRIDNVQPTNEGNYTVVLRNDFGTTNSYIARLTYGAIIEGQVVDATTGNGIPDALVSVGNVSTNTDINGNYTLVGVRPGASKADFDAKKRVVRIREPVQFENQSASSKGTLRCKKQPEFFDFEDSQFEVQLGKAVTNKISMSPKLSGLRFVVTWGLQPADLDVHLWVPQPGEPDFNISYLEEQRGSLEALPFARLDTDATNSFGPETITIQQFSPGIYRLYVKKFDASAVGNLASSVATVRVYDVNGLYGTRKVPTSGTGSVWHVADYDSNRRSLTWVDQLRTEDPLGPNLSDTRVNGASLSAASARSGLARLQAEVVPGARYVWTFGDGEGSERPDPEPHPYRSPGLYTVTLRMILADGSTFSAPKTNFITVYNEEPRVSLIAPLDGTLFREGMTVPLEAEASDLDGEVQKVEFIALSGPITGKLGESTRAPYQFGALGLPQGDYQIIARATDDFGGVGVSKRVKIRILDLSGEILIIRNFADAEIDGLVDYLTTLRIPDGSGFSIQPTVRVLESAGLYLDLIRHFKLVIWDDVGRLDSGIDDSLVDLLASVQQIGIPLYFIGEHLAQSSQRLSSAFDTWQSLVQLRQPNGVTDPGTVELNMDNNNRRRFFRKYGTVAPFTYDRPTESAPVFSGNSDVVITLAGVPVMLASPPFREPDFGDARSVSQTFRVKSGVDTESLDLRKTLFLNTAAWLLRLDCQTFGLNVQCEDSPATGKIGEAITLSALITQNGECTAGGVLLTNSLSDGFELIGFELTSPNGASDTNQVRLDRLETGLLSRFPRLAKEDQFRISLTVVPRQGGRMTNRYSAVLFPFAPIHCEQVIVVENPCDKERVLLRAEVAPTGELTLIATGSAGCRFTIESSIDLHTWNKVSEVTPSPVGQRVVLTQPLVKASFFHLVLKP